MVNVPNGVGLFERGQGQCLIGPRGLWSAAIPESISTTPEVRLLIIVIDAGKSIPSGPPVDKCKFVIFPFDCI